MPSFASRNQTQHGQYTGGHIHIPDSIHNTASDRSMHCSGNYTGHDNENPPKADAETGVCDWDGAGAGNWNWNSGSESERGMQPSGSLTIHMG